MTPPRRPSAKRKAREYFVCRGCYAEQNHERALRKPNERIKDFIGYHNGSKCKVIKVREVLPRRKKHAR